MTRREGAALAGLFLVLIGAAGYAGFRVWDWWTYGGEIAVDFDPEPPSEPVRGSIDGFPASPDGHLTAAQFGERTVVVERPGRAAVADLGEVGSTIFVTDDVLVVFGEDRFGHEGSAVVHLADRSVDQVEHRVDTDGPLHAMRVRPDGLVVACDWRYSSSASTETCGPDRYLLDPATASLERAPWSPPPLPDGYD